MERFVSKYDSNVDLEFVTRNPESLYLERKELGKKPSGIADELVGMLNADGGVLMYGVTDIGDIQDVYEMSEKELEKYRTLHQRLIKPAPPIKFEEAEYDGKRFFLYHVREDNENIYSRKDSNNVFKRVGNSNYGPLTIEEVDNLRYDKNLRNYEDQIVEDFDEQDFDFGLIEEYKRKIKFDGTNSEVLLYRNLAKKDRMGVVRYCNSAVLLFAKDPEKYIPSSYIRYVRYDGSVLEPGVRFNVIKDETIGGNIPSIIRKTRDFLRASFGEFYVFDVENATFVRVAEYPEDAWLEGVVNAVFHRSYNMHGNCIRIQHFDDRLEISNSGPLPAQVNVWNIREQRFSRNPRIGRVLYEMGYVRELNEGVKRIYSSMSESRLSEPVYTDEDSIVTLRLENPAYRSEKRLPADFLKNITEKMGSYNLTKKSIISYLLMNGHATIRELAKHSDASDRTIRNNLDGLIVDGVIVRNSEKQRDKNAKYTFNIK